MRKLYAQGKCNREAHSSHQQAGVKISVHEGMRMLVWCTVSGN